MFSIFDKYFPKLEPETRKRLEALVPLYSDWNQKINVVSRKDIENLVERHIIHSMSISKIIRFRPETTILDVGTGGGFPGIPLAILFPETDFHLIDPIGKKIKVVDAVINELELTNVRAEQKRVENVKAKYDFVVSRAVMSFPELVKLTLKNISDKQKNGLPNGIICLKGGDIKTETEPYRHQVSIFKLSDYFDEEFFETKKIVYMGV